MRRNDDALTGLQQSFNAEYQSDNKRARIEIQPRL